MSDIWHVFNTDKPHSKKDKIEIYIKGTSYLFTEEEIERLREVISRAVVDENINRYFGGPLPMALALDSAWYRLIMLSSFLDAAKSEQDALLCANPREREFIKEQVKLIKAGLEMLEIENKQFFDEMEAD